MPASNRQVYNVQYLTNDGRFSDQSTLSEYRHNQNTTNQQNGDESTKDNNHIKHYV